MICYDFHSALGFHLLSKHIQTSCHPSSVEYDLCTFFDSIARTSVLASFHNSLIHHLQLSTILLVYLQVNDEQTECPFQISVI